MSITLGGSLLTLLSFVAVSCSDPRGEPFPQGSPTKEGVALPNERVRIWPSSGEAEVGVKYAYDTSLCGLTYDLDFDGSFWEPVDRLSNEDQPDFFINPDQGSITLISEQEATYESSEGQTVELQRLDGPVVQRGCG